MEALMATVAAHPRWEVHPLTWWEGRETVDATYRFLMPQDEVSVAEVIRASEDPTVARWGDSHVVIEFAADPGRYPCHYGMVLVVVFDQGLVQGEHLYLTDPSVVDGFRQPMQRLSDAVPGVHWFDPWRPTDRVITFADRT